MFDSVLIANRGEIAVRIIRACRDLGLRAVAVYSDVDAAAPHVALADDAVRIGEASPADSYLNQQRIIEAALDAGAGAIHPGYGFLAENGDFARAVEAAGLVFVGPSASVIDTMGNKVEARNAAIAAGVPVVPGSPGALHDADAAVEFTRAHGFPVAFKALHGGGGRGMRIVRDSGDVREAFEAAVREATMAFGRGECYAERYVERPRHVEVQILADGQGTTLHLGDRDCSLQRRHQKLIEEAPAPRLRDDVRRAMGEAAVRLARHTGYVNAGTCEFLLDADGETFYFLEMNTRLQVEHPVTELVTGLDLVREQLRIAQGKSLPLQQDGVRITGHAIEVRVNAEDPADGFAPRSGTVRDLCVPLGPWVRFDSGLVSGQEVSPHYDSLIGKLVTWGSDRDEALSRMERSLGELDVTGVATTIPFHRFAVTHPQFVAADHATVSVETEWDLSTIERQEPDMLDDSSASLTARPVALPTREVRLTFGGRAFDITVTGGAASPRASSSRTEGAAGGARDDAVTDGPELRSPIQGVVTRIEVTDGTEVAAGDPICVVEAMKMENLVTAHRDGRVQVAVAVGEAIGHRAVLATIDAAE